MSVMSTVREESLESSADSMPILAETYLDHSADLTLPEDFRWRPAQAQTQAQLESQLTGSVAGKPFRQKSSATWLDGLYIVLALTSVAVCASQVMASATW